jgi:hypothetical protein
MQTTGNIEEISLIEKNGKQYYKLKINSKNFTAFADTEAYKQLTEKQFNQGETIIYDYTETPGTFKGQQILYKNLVKLIKTSQTPEPNTTQKQIHIFNKFYYYYYYYTIQYK